MVLVELAVKKDLQNEDPFSLPITSDYVNLFEGHMHFTLNNTYMSLSEMRVNNL